MRERDKKNSKPRRDRDEQGARTRLTPEVMARVKELALASIPRALRRSTNVYIDRRILQPGDSVGPPFAPITADRPSILCFVDDYPMAAFGHPCRYIFHDARTLEPVRRVLADFPPYPRLGLRALEPLSLPIRRPEYAPSEPRALQTFRRAKKKKKKTAAKKTAGGAQRFAILFAGDTDDNHLNDLELSYRILREVYDFDETKIFTLIHEGTRDPKGPYGDEHNNPRLWPGAAPGEDPNWQIKPDFPGTKAAFRSVLADVRSQIGPNDLLFIHTEGHGGHYDFNWEDRAFLSCTDDTDNDPYEGMYYAADFASDLALFPPFQSLLVLMNQCYAGGFSKVVVDKSTANVTSIACAATSDRIANGASDMGYRWMDFSLDWLEAQMLKHVSGGGPLSGAPTPKPDGSVRAREAFEYAETHNIGKDSPNIRPDVPDKPGPPPPANDLSLR